MMPVLNPNKLSESQLNALAECYEEIANEPLKPLPEMDSDPVRAKIDEAIAYALNLPNFYILRRLLAQEPVISLRRL
ncbi:MAG: hypothetical protein ABIK23_02350 [candidate division WOR-3 bacterium]